MAKFNSVFDRIIGICMFLSGFIIFFQMALVTVDIVMRYFFRMPIIWANEITEYGILFTAFFGATWVLKKEGHVRVDLLLERLTPRARALTNIITSIVATIVVAPFVWYGIKVTLDAYHNHLYFTGSIMYTPKAAVLWVIPVCSLLLFIQLIRRTHGYLADYQKERARDTGVVGVKQEEEI